MKLIAAAKRVLVVLAFLTATGVQAQTSGEGTLGLEPAKFGAWWIKGEAVKYRISNRNVPNNLASVEGIVTDIDGRKIATVEVSARDLREKGWEWQPEKPGYYEVEFSYTLAEETQKHPVSLSFQMKAQDGAVKDFVRTKQGFAVVPPQDVPENPVGQFGFTYSDSNDVPLAKMIGLDLVRIHLWWGPVFGFKDTGIERIKGTYDWAEIDQSAELLRKNGFIINMQFLSTPLWASPHPEKTNPMICFIEGAAYAPKDMADFERFVEAAVTRYKDRVNLWEIWNEPSVPGGSVFWNDTPENYVRLLESGATTVKRLQPEAEIWIGGLGPRSPYHAFYMRILSLGADKFFDVLSLHGSWNTPAEKFRDIEKVRGVAPKPAVHGEWHAILQGNMQSEPILADRTLSYRMMRDLLYQLKQGVSRTMIFEMKNLTEKEALTFAKEHKMFTHSAGLFRRRPQYEPRQPAVVMANFLDITGRKAKYVREIDLSSDVVAIQLETNNGPIVAFWSESGVIDQKILQKISTPQSKVVDWEGKDIAPTESDGLEKAKIYFLTSANSVESEKLASTTDRLVSPRTVAKREGASVVGSFADGRLFETIKSSINNSSVHWINDGWKQTRLLNSASDSLKVAAAVGAHQAGLDVVVEVTDDVFVQEEAAPAWWNGDSVQIGIDCERNGLFGGNTEIIAALTGKGPVLWKISAADPQGDIPSRWSGASSPVKFAESEITRAGNVTRYKIRLPWSELYPLTYDPSKPLQVSIVVNNNDGAGRAGYFEWGGGIANGKDSSMYGTLKPAKP